MALIKRAAFGLGLALALLCCSSWLAVAQEFKPPKRGTPGRRESAGTRSASCTDNTVASLTALLPTTNLGLTTAAYPRFFWFLPKTQAKFAEFTLSDVDPKTGDSTPVYETTFRLSGTTGIASLTVPSNAGIPPLTIDKDYQWSVAIICDPDRREQDMIVEGWVQRVELPTDLRQQLAKATPVDRVQLYANNGFWFDTLTTLAELRCTQPKAPSVTASWASILRSVKLTAIADQPLIQSCDKPR